MDEGTHSSSESRIGVQSGDLSWRRSWLNFILFMATVLSTFFVGLSWSIAYRYADAFAQNSRFVPDPAAVADPSIIWLSMVYAGVLLTILLGHELGHFLTCRYYRIDATLPYFIPAPTLIGTLGAFIKIRSPITSKKPLFDIGIAGPLTGFFLALPALVYGLAHSKVVPPLPREGSLIFGEPLILKLLGSVFFRGIPEGMDIVPHPVAFAGWVGVLVTALNLFPIGQLDGGHVLYALIGARAKKLVPLFLGIFVFLGIFFWVGWFVWALLVYFLGLKHPRLYDEESPLSPGRKILGMAVLVIFILSFIPDPIKGYDLIHIVRQLPFP